MAPSGAAQEIISTNPATGAEVARVAVTGGFQAWHRFQAMAAR